MGMVVGKERRGEERRGEERRGERGGRKMGLKVWIGAQ
jgi:hypothetical protein